MAHPGQEAAAISAVSSLEVQSSTLSSNNSSISCNTLPSSLLASSMASSPPPSTTASTLGTTSTPSPTSGSVKSFIRKSATSAVNTSSPSSTSEVSGAEAFGVSKKKRRRTNRTKPGTAKIPAKKGRPPILHDVALRIIGADSNIQSTLNNREFSTERSKELQHDLINVICHELGSISDYTFNNLMRDLNPESHAPPLTVITEENQEKELERREKFVDFLHDSIQSRLAQIVRSVAPKEIKKREEELRAMTLMVGESPQVTHFDKWHIGHAVHGWKAKLKSEYHAQYGALPTGKHAPSLRARYCRKWLDTKEDREVVKELRAEHAALKKDITAFWDTVHDLSEGHTEGDSKSAADRHMQVLSLVPLAMNLINGFSSKLGIGMMMWMSGNLLGNAGFGEQDRVLNMENSFGDGVSTFAEWDPRGYEYISQSYMAFVAAGIAYRVHGTPMPKVEDVAANYTRLFPSTADGASAAVPPAPVPHASVPSSPVVAASPPVSRQGSVVPETQDVVTRSESVVPGSPSVSAGTSISLAAAVTRSSTPGRDTAVTCPSPPATRISPASKSSMRSVAPHTPKTSSSRIDMAFKSSMLQPNGSSTRAGKNGGPASAELDPAPPYSTNEQDVPASPQALVARRLLYPPSTPARPRKRPSPIIIPIMNDDAQETQEKKLPFRPELSLPLMQVFAPESMSEDDLGFGTINLDILPINPIFKKARDGSTAAVSLASATGPTSVFDDASKAYMSLENASSPTGLAEIDSSHKTLGVRIGKSGSACISGDAIRISEDGTSAVAVGANARAMAVKPLDGVVAAAFFRKGQAHAEWSKSVDPPAPTVTSLPKKQRAKRRRTGSNTSIGESSSTTPTRPRIKHTYGKKTQVVEPALNAFSSISTAATSSTSLEPSVATTTTSSISSNDIITFILLSASPRDISVSKVTIKNLTNTALHEVKDVVISKLSTWGKGVTEVLGLAIEIESNKSLPASGRLSITDKRRPMPITQFGKSYRKFQNNVFNTFKPGWTSHLWSWWITLQDGMREIVGVGDARRPGAFEVHADWSPLLIRGVNGIWLVVVAIVLWRENIDRLPVQRDADLRAWAEFVVDVKRIVMQVSRYHA